jgi:hypothetical protein
MTVIRSAFLAAVCVFVFLVSCEKDDPTRPSPHLNGAWDLVGYADHGVSGVTTGSAVFRDDSSFVILGTVTYPGEPVDSLRVSGTYQVVDMVATLKTPDGTGAWSLAFSGNRCVLTLAGSVPPTTMTLKRQT